jgi:biopolymer transport protein ExbD
MRFQPRRREEPEINLTSLIDVVLLLVIFFMVSTSFTVDGRLRLTLPQSGAVPDRRPADPVVIAVTADGLYSVNDRVLANATPATLSAALADARSNGGARRTLTIRADARATHQAVVTAMDVAGKAGFTQVNIATVNARN